jgi:hypothetical protein
MPLGNSWAGSGTDLAEKESLRHSLSAGGYYGKNDCPHNALGYVWGKFG